jgi:hypothetical protein
VDSAVSLGGGWGLRTELRGWGAQPPRFLGGTVMTEDQTDLLKMYIAKMRDGEDYDWVIINDRPKKRYFIQSRHHRDALDNLLAALGGEPRPSTADETEAEIRAKLLIWSPPSCP